MRPCFQSSYIWVSDCITNPGKNGPDVQASQTAGSANGPVTEIVFKKTLAPQAL